MSKRKSDEKEEKIYALRKIKYQETQMINMCDLDILGKKIQQ
ncbi:MAG: hypothetical protein ACTHKK_08320 [Candidatus Nitrosocosmicus sp.]